MKSKNSIKELMNEWGAAAIPFVFIIDFENNEPRIYRTDEIDPEKLLYSINGITNCTEPAPGTRDIRLIKHPEPYENYLAKFNLIKGEILRGNSYLLNLTCSTPIELNFSLKDVFLMANARYKLWLNDKFVCFSPEIFVTIKEGVIRSFPMKGTIDASIPDAAEAIMNDRKETAEHYTIVDLLRNDLNMVSKNVRVERFRYIETIATHESKLLQVSSEIAGVPDSDFCSHLGDIFYDLLPAGSVSGAPKKKTMEIILDTEGYKRGYYTGVFGLFDGKNVDSGVMIRFIEKNEKGLFYKSGGGITSFSDPQSEYLEMIEKIYVPVI